VTIPAGCHQ